MAAPVASYVQLPSDASNTGKLNRTQTKAVGSNTVHEHFVVPAPNYTRVGRYCYMSTGAVVNASSGTQFDVMALSTSATQRAYIRHISVTWSQQGESVVCETGPVILVTKCTYNTALTDATTRAMLSYASSQSAPQVNIRSSSSGASLGTKIPFCGFAVPAFVSTASAYGGSMTLYDVSDSNQTDNSVELKAGEALVVYQADAGTGSDVRKFTLRIVWDEVDIT